MVYEGATGEASRGRKPTFLYMDSRGRCAVAVDIRATRSYLMITDLVGPAAHGDHAASRPSSTRSSS